MSGDVNRSTLAYIRLWHHAAKLQMERVAMADRTSFHAESVLLLAAAQGVARASKGVVPAAHAAFEAALPGLKPFRDTVEHFEDYAVGRGRRQDWTSGQDVGTLMIHSGAVVRAANAVTDFVMLLNVTEHGIPKEYRVQRHRLEPALDALVRAVAAGLVGPTGDDRGRPAASAER